MKKQYSIQEWLPFEKILSNGIVKVNSSQYVKILKVHPISYYLKSDLEKQAILNSYKIFLKTCDFDIQILIQSKKENLSPIFLKLEEQKKQNQNTPFSSFYDSYIQFLKQITSQKQSFTKDFFILLKNSPNNSNENAITEQLNSNYYKIKECLARCGNVVSEMSEKQEVKQILFSFFNSRIYFNQ